MISTYYRLMKPGIVYSNAMAALAAFVFASQGHVDVVLLVGMLVGISFSIASACVVNNILDRDIDTHMERTKKRALPTGRISILQAALFATVLFGIGFSSLFFLTNFVALVVTLFGVVVYVGVYTPLKRVSRHSTIVGALAGAVPPVVGYVAVTGTLDLIALALFLVLICWQMVHFLAIAIFRMEEYRAAKIPVMSVHFSIARTKMVMIVYAFLFMYALAALAVVAQLGLLYTLPIGLLSLGWTILSFKGFHTQDDAAWARTMFFYSIAILIVFCFALALS